MREYSWRSLQQEGELGSGSFGAVVRMRLPTGESVAVKANSTISSDSAAIDNERRLYELVLAQPHDHVLQVLGICTDAPDGQLRLLMHLCEQGSLDAHLKNCKYQVGPFVAFGGASS